MQIILASAKIMHDHLKSMPNVDMTKPRFQNEAAAFARDMASYPIETIAEMLTCSHAIATQSKLRFMHHLEEAATMPAGKPISTLRLRRLLQSISISRSNTCG